MAENLRRRKGGGKALPNLSTTIDGVNIAKGAAPAKYGLGSVATFLTMIEDTMINDRGYDDLGQACTEIVEALVEGAGEESVDDLNPPVRDAIHSLVKTVVEIQGGVIERSNRNALTRLFRSRDDKRVIAGWTSELDRILQVFNTQLITTIHVNTVDIRKDTKEINTTVASILENTETANTTMVGVLENTEKANTTVASVLKEARKNNITMVGVLKNAEKANIAMDNVIKDLLTIRAAVSEIHKRQNQGNGSAILAISIFFVFVLVVSVYYAANYPYYSIQDPTPVPIVPGELPPSPPRIFFGRDELVEKIVHLSENLTPIALIGAGGIGKTSIALTALHDDRIKQRFGGERRFIRCDEFPATRNHFLRQLSQVIGAGIENPENIGSLRPFLSSKEMFIVLDNAESILDPGGPDAREIHADVDELTRFSNICVCITSRISTVPPDCRILEIPTLSPAAASETFYRIYQHGGRSDSINEILEQLDFHPLSISLLATVAQQSKWGTDRLITEWERRRTGVLRLRHSESLATTIEISLDSPMFQELGPDARSLLEVVAFFPQGVNENNTDWLFPTIPDIQSILDRFCMLSLAYRHNEFITMLAPLRDHLRPKDPGSSRLLNATKEIYFGRLSGEVSPGEPSFEEALWITTEDVNVEYLLDAFTTIDPSSESIWDAWIRFMGQLYWHKSRTTTLGPKMEALPDDSPWKPRYLLQLARLFESVGNLVESKRLLSHALELWSGQRNDFQAAQTLSMMSYANLRMGLHSEAIPQVVEASEIFRLLGRADKQADCLINLVELLRGTGQLDAAEGIGLQIIDLLPEKGQELLVCHAHRALGETYQSKGETEKAIHHFEVVLGIASSINSAYQLFWINFALARLYFHEGQFEDAQMHVEHAKAHVVNDPYHLARLMGLQAHVWGEQGRFEEARSEALRALDVFEKLGATLDVEDTRERLQYFDARRAG